MFFKKVQVTGEHTDDAVLAHFESTGRHDIFKTKTVTLI